MTRARTGAVSRVVPAEATFEGAADTLRPDAWDAIGHGVKIVDETLREGLQSPSAIDPSIDDKRRLLHAMAGAGVDVVSVGLPAAGDASAAHARVLCCEIRDAKLPLVATAAARTVAADVDAIARIADDASLPIEVYAFIGCSPMRHLVEEWDRDFVVDSIRTSVRTARTHGLALCLVLEDATRSHPTLLRDLLAVAVGEGASRVCLCDTAGHATAHGATQLTRFARHALDALGATAVGLDWHAHNDRGLAVSTALWAAASGADRIHGTALGIGERVGNASLELLVENLRRLGPRRGVSRASLAAYVMAASEVLAWRVPDGYSILERIDDGS